MAFPQTREEIDRLARELVRHLRHSITNTHGRKSWSLQNFQALESFAVSKSAVAFFRSPERSHREFLWDFVAGYSAGDEPWGALFVAESEHNLLDLHDWEKLFYAKAPLKVMMVRIGSEADAEAQKDRFVEYMQQNHRAMYPGEAYVLYGVFWSEQNGLNRDIAYLFQAPGEPNLQLTQPVFARLEA